ncbi:AIR synthase [Cyanobium sp. ATX 6A2]|jgi:Fe-S cluster assembly iron-binding protein IscA|uniref:AIR synthase n=1 Tax=Cyanobium sp. ATX 6A2 TaxID=2823700 RepID=UPI0020CCED00|nr:AIR synthase [Cyanobium sp. ATX 6A2]MCP9889151.1 AIR synthase [Cyanobium sp. ATX 6A2]
MPKGHSLRLTSAAAAELGRQAAVAGTPGLMHVDLVEGGCEQWTIRLRPGHLAGVPIARADGVTLHAPLEQTALLAGLSLDYRGDLSGGGFLVRSAEGVRTCACGAAFSPLLGRGRATR